MEFEWDENKRLTNLAKHNFDFADAAFIFIDPYRITFVDNRKDYGEIRERTIGMFMNELIVSVIHTNRHGKIRIISARRANKKERSMYYGNR